MHYAMITFSAAVEYIRSEKLRCSGTVLAAGACGLGRCFADGCFH